MKNSLLLLAFFYVPVFANVRLSDKAGRLLGETVFPFKKLTTLDSFKNFFELVEAKKLNVSLVRSATKVVDKSFYQYSTIVTYPYFKERNTQTNFTIEECEKFLDLARTDKVAAKISLSRREKTYQVSNTYDAMAYTNGHVMVTSFWEKTNGIGSRDKNYVVHKTYFTTGADGKNATVKVIWGNIDVRVVNSHNFTDEEINLNKKLFARVIIAYSLKDMGQALAAMFSRTYPDQKWQVVSTTGQYSYVKAKRMITFQIGFTKYVIYSM